MPPVYLLFFGHTLKHVPGNYRIIALYDLAIEFLSERIQHVVVVAALPLDMLGAFWVIL